MAEAHVVDRPYPGLRPFEAWEGEIFFGREAHIDRLQEILRDQRFLAVIGPSGSGKSSLVRAGLLPALPLGAIGTGSDWRVAILRPGNRPIRSLARALLDPEVLGAELHDLAPVLLEAELRADTRSLARLVADIRQRVADADFNLLVVVDQFEELFTYAEAGSEQSDESEAFVNLLIQSTVDHAQRVFAILTMRTDFLGQCVRFLDLPEAINHGQYLTPRMTRDQLHEAIGGPARLFGGDVDDALVEELINGVDGNPDQLPVLQHALARMWRAASRRDPAHPVIGRDDHAAIGGVDKALGQHADQVFELLDAPARQAAEWLFRAVTAARDTHALVAQIVRRPCSLKKIARWSGLPPERFLPVLAAFTDDDVCFLVASGPHDDPESVVDISHEALIRQWSRLSAWTLNEAQRAIGFQRLAERALDYANGNQLLLQGIELARAEAWRNGGHLADGAWAPTPEWAERYWDAKSGLPDLGAILVFIDRSREEVAAEARRDAEEKQREKEAEQDRLRAEQAVAAERRAKADARRLRRLAMGLLAAMLAVGVLAVVAYRKSAEASHATDLATIRGVAAESPAVVDGVLPGGTTLGMLQMLAAYRLATQDAFREVFPAALGTVQREFVRSRQLERLIENAEAVTALAISPDGSRLVSGSREGSLHVRDVASGTEVGRAGKLPTYINGVAFSPDGRRFVSAGKDGILQRWDAATGEPLGAPMRKDPQPVGSVAFSPDGRRIVAGGGSGLGLWDAETGAPLDVPPEAQRERMYVVAYSPDGRLVVSGNVDGVLRIWDGASGAPLGEFAGRHEGAVYALAFSPDGRRLVSGGRDRALRLWDVATRQPLGKPLAGHTADVNGVAFSPDGRLIVSASEDRSLRLWDGLTGAPAGEPVGEPIKGHGDEITRVVFVPDGRRFVSGSYDKTLRVWRVGDDTVMSGHAGEVKGVAVSPDGQRIVSGSADHTLRLWRAHAGAWLGAPLVGHLNEINGVAFSPDGTRIVSASEDTTLRLWDGDTGAALGAPWAGHAAGVSGVAFAPDGQRVVSGGADGQLRVWDAAVGTSIGGPVEGDSRNVTGVAFSPDGRRIASGGEDQAVRLWDTATLGRVWQSAALPNLVSSVAFSPDGLTVASGSHDKTVRLWHAGSGVPVGAPMAGHTNQVHSVAYSPDGRYIVSGSGDGTLRLWNVATGMTLGDPLRGHGGPVRSVAFAPDGRFVVSGSADRTVRRWPVLEGWADALCAKLQRNMSAREWRERVSRDIPYVKQCEGLPVPAE